MNRVGALVVEAIVLGGLALTLPARGDGVEIAGWFSDELCATGRVKSGEIGPTNRECAERCIAKGAKMVFIDEKGKRLLQVANPAAAKGQESHYVRVTGSVVGDTLTVESVDVLKEYVAMCRRPARK